MLFSYFCCNLYAACMIHCKTSSSGHRQQNIRPHLITRPSRKGDQQQKNCPFIGLAIIRTLYHFCLAHGSMINISYGPTIKNYCPPLFYTVILVLHALLTERSKVTDIYTGNKKFIGLNIKYLLIVLYSIEFR